MSRPPLRVIKVGGSLFDLPDLADRLHSFFGESAEHHDILIAGGGPLVDKVRELDATQPIDGQLAHWMCVELMSVTARLLADRLQLESALDDFAQLADAESRGTIIFDPSNWLRSVESDTAGKKLPVGWEVTSDSIAARLAKVIHADELILLKSALPDSDDLSQLARTGYVDEAFPTFAAGLPVVRFVNLRHLQSLTVG